MITGSFVYKLKRSAPSVIRIVRFLLCFGLAVSLGGCSLLDNCTGSSSCINILFIGNSYTYVNDLPGMFASLAKSGNHRVRTVMSAQGGMTFTDHLRSVETLDKIKSTQWDFVVLQEQSQVPSVMAVRNAQMYPSARALVSLIRKNGAEPIFFLTWAHRAGWQENGMPNYASMQQNINAGYMSIAHELDTMVAPVGVAWSEALRQNPQAPLWQADGSHPAAQGTYLAACVFYAVIFQESPEGLSYRDNLTTADAQWLQAIAADLVLNHKAQWNIK